MGLAFLTEKYRFVFMIHSLCFLDILIEALGVQNISTIMFENKLTQILKCHEMNLDPVRSFEGSCTSCLSGTYSSSIGKLSNYITVFKSAFISGLRIEKIFYVDSWQPL